MRDTEPRLKISELSTRSRVPVSTIKFYIRKRLLPGPMKTGGTRGYYTRKHLDRLRLIRKIRRDGNMSLDKVREITEMIDLAEERERRMGDTGGWGQRLAIIRAATPVFRRKGYEAVRIADLVEAAGIGRSTFYKHFRGKKDLFIACIREIIRSEGAPGTGGPVDRTDGFALFDRSAEAYFRESPLWSDMVKRLRAAAVNAPEEFGEVLEEAMEWKIDAFRKRIKTSMRQGFMRKVDPTLLAVMLLGIQDYCSEYVSKGKFDRTPEQIFEGVKDILLHGIRQGGKAR